LNSIVRQEYVGNYVTGKNRLLGSDCDCDLLSDHSTSRKGDDTVCLGTLLQRAFSDMDAHDCSIIATCGHFSFFTNALPRTP